MDLVEIRYCEGFFLRQCRSLSVPLVRYYTAVGPEFLYQRVYVAGVDSGRNLMDGWKERAARAVEMLRTSMMFGGLGAYEAKLDGLDVIVIGHIEPQDDGLNSSTPIALVVDEAIFERIEPVDGARAVYDRDPTRTTR